MASVCLCLCACICFFKGNPRGEWNEKGQDSFLHPSLSLPPQCCTLAAQGLKSPPSVLLSQPPHEFHHLRDAMTWVLSVSVNTEHTTHPCSNASCIRGMPLTLSSVSFYLKPTSLKKQTKKTTLILSVLEALLARYFIICIFHLQWPDSKQLPELTFSRRHLQTCV